VKDMKVPPTTIKDKELEMALALVDQLSGKFDPQKYKDSYTDDLLKIIDQKSKGKSIKTEAPTKATPKVNDLMALLKESLKVKKKTKDKSIA
jgi:DNA end-binding protein Ku